MLGRNTSWRQGSLLSKETACSLNLMNRDDIEKIAVIISHDCDLASDETTFEVIVGTMGVNVNKDFRGAKHPRRLQLFYTENNGGESKTIIVELTHADRKVIPRARLDEQCSLNDSLHLLEGEKRSLKQWLAARYGRPAFPNKFEGYLRKSTKKRLTVESEISTILRKDTEHLVGLFFDLEDCRNKDLPDGEAYPLNIVVVYDHIESVGELGRVQAERISAELIELFHRAYGKPEDATEIALGTCEGKADIYFSLADLRRMDQWRLEYISLRNGSEIIASDELNL